MTGIECRHGALAGVCGVCALEAEVAELRAANREWERTAAEALQRIRELEVNLASAESECKRMRNVIERDRSLVAAVMTSFRHHSSRWGWLIEGRGSYEYDDDRYRREFSSAMNAMESAIEPLRTLAGDWSDCPTTSAEIREARATQTTKEG
jgi:hypothetical protein